MHFDVLCLSKGDDDVRFNIRAWHHDARANDLTATSYSLYLVPETFAGINDMNDVRSAQVAGVAHYEDRVPR